MARKGRRLTIGGTGVSLSDEDSLSQTGSRGEVRSYQPPSEAAQAAEAAKIGAGAAAADKDATGDTVPSIVIIDAGVGGPGEPGQAANEGGPTGEPGQIGPDAPTSGGPPGSDAPGEGGPGPGDTGGMKRGGAVQGSEKEHPVTAQNGEWIIQESSVKKYGDAFMKKLNAGEIPVMSADAYAKGGKVTSSGPKYRRLA